MNLRSEYYVQQPDYFVLKQLSIMIDTPTTTSAELIDYMIKHSINANKYIYVYDNYFVPIIYAIIRNENYWDFYKWLIVHGADPNKIPDCDEKFCHNILFICHDRYFKDLVKRKIFINSRTVQRQIYQKMEQSNICRLQQLLHVKKLSSQQIAEVVANINLAEVVKVLLEKVNLIFYSETNNTKANIEQIITKYVDTVKFMITYKMSDDAVTAEADELLTKFYLWELIAVINPIRKITSVPVYHEQLDPITVCKFRQLLNDYRYVQTCKILGITPVKEAF